MHKLMFSIGLILLIAFSVFSPLQIMKIESVNAQVTVPKTYIQTVNDPYINSPYAWENFTTGLDPDSYAHVPGASSYWYDWRNITIGTSYGSYNTSDVRNWTIQNHSNNNDSVLICLEGGMFGYCHPAIETFAPFSEYLTVITNIYDAYYGIYWGNDWIKPLADALRTMGFTYVHFLGFSSGAMCVASYLCHHDEGVFDSGIVISGYLNQTHEDSDLDVLANYSNNVTTPIYIITPTMDARPDYGNGTLEAEQFYGNLPGGLTKELHYFDGGHQVFWYYEVGTGKTAYEVVGEWIDASYDWVNVTLGTPYNGWGSSMNRNWTMQNHSPNNDSVLICLNGGEIGFCDPGRETFEPFSNALTVVTNVYMVSYCDICTYNHSWIIPLANALKAMGFSHIYFLGFSSGAICVASYLCHFDNGTTFDSAIVISGMLDDHENPTIPSIEELANYSGNVTTKTEILHGIDDVVCYYCQALGFYSNLTVSGKEMHTFNGGHDIFSNTEISTGKSVYQVVEEFLNFPVSNDDNDEFGTFTAYCKRVGADEWGDCIARQGYYPHLNRYCLDWDNKIIKPMVHFPYIPGDIGDDQIILQATGKHSAPVWHGNIADPFKSPWGPTIGGTIMLYFNVWVHDNVNNVDKWLFNFHEPNPWAGPNMFILEIFLTRWIHNLVNWYSCPPGTFQFEQFVTRTTHDNDLHRLTCPFDMPVSDQWYYFLYDLGPLLRQSKSDIEAWSFDEWHGTVYSVYGFQLMTIAMGVETIGGSWTFQFGDLSLTDMRWGTGSAYQNSATYELKTRVDGDQYVPKLGGSIGYPNPLRPYRTYTNDALDSDVNGDGTVTYKDVSIVGRKYRDGSSEVTPTPYSTWDYACDIIKDRVINYQDMGRIGQVYISNSSTGVYSTGLGSIKVWMQEFDISGGLGLYWPDPPPNYVGPPWTQFRTTPYTCHLYLEMWDVIDWPDHVSRTKNYNPCTNYMGRAVFYNGTTLNATGTCLYAYDYPIHD